MLAGVHGIDLVLLIVAADEGIMPQTIEHFDICRLLEVKSGIIVLTKSDLADEDLHQIVLQTLSILCVAPFWRVHPSSLSAPGPEPVSKT
jgi:selenocysteine-specific elongation factor